MAVKNTENTQKKNEEYNIKVNLGNIFSAQNVGQALITAGIYAASAGLGIMVIDLIQSSFNGIGNRILKKEKYAEEVNKIFEEKLKESEKLMEETSNLISKTKERMKKNA